MNSNPTNPNAKIGNEEKVKREYPDAWIQESRVFNQWTVYEFKFPANTVLSQGKTKEEAWQRAASRLRAEEGIGEAEPMEEMCRTCGHTQYWHSLTSDIFTPAAAGCLAANDDDSAKCSCKKFKSAGQDMTQSDEGKPTESAQQDYLPPLPKERYWFSDDEIMASLSETEYAKTKIRSRLNMMSCNEKYALFRAVIETAKLAGKIQIVTAPSTPVSAPQDGIALVQQERRRQIDKHGWTPEHDDGHSRGEMMSAAMDYVAECKRLLRRHDISIEEEKTGLPWGWPWAKVWWKPSPDPIRNLVKAAALIVAEIERLQRVGQEETKK